MDSINTSPLPNPAYSPEDLAILIPTKDRPEEVQRLLQSIAELDCMIGRIIVIASGQEIRDEVMAFQGVLPVEYHYSQPGQIQQRNLGIAKLDESTRLVASLDDDVQLHRSAVSEMISYWNSVPLETAGIGFNIVNQPGVVRRWYDIFYRGGREPGKVMKSGQNIPTTNLKESIQCEWLSGGATVWRQDILKTYPHHEVRSRWAVFEDVIFSYPIGRIFPLYVCADAKIEIEDVSLRNESNQLVFYQGKTQFLWGLYFVLSNPSLSLYHYMVYHILNGFRWILVGITKLKTYPFFKIAGLWVGFILSLKGVVNKRTIVEIIEENT